MSNLQTTISSADIPDEVSRVTSMLKDTGFQAYLVGGCVRDLIRNTEPNDWDVATNATPEEMLGVFEHAHYDNDFGTVRIVNDNTDDSRLKVVEATTYRTEAAYSDDRRPDTVEFSTRLEDDLKRRDFTINAMALDVPRKTSIQVSRETDEGFVDLFSGLDDLKNGVIRTVGDPHERFAEDALRMLRAVRFAAALDFDIEENTRAAIEEYAEKLKNIAVERLRTEFVQIIESPQPRKGLEGAHDLGILQYIVPDFERTVGIEQNQAHDFTVFEHLMRSVQATADKNWPLHIRLAALFHDISKPESRRWSDEKEDWTFYGHEVVGSRVTKRIMQDLKFSNELTEQVTNLVRWHMFFSDPDEISMSAVRRLIRNVGEENIWDLIKIRIADRVGTGRPKERPYRLRKYESMIEEALRDPVSVQKLAIDGNDVMEIADIRPGPQIGHILHTLLEEVLDDPDKNTREYLAERTRELAALPDEELKDLGERGERAKYEEEEEAVRAIRDKYWVE